MEVDWFLCELGLTEVWCGCGMCTVAAASSSEGEGGVKEGWSGNVVQAVRDRGMGLV